MMITAFFIVLSFAFGTVDAYENCGEDPRGVLRFGPGCGFMCHCRNNEQCHSTTGECTDGCASFWYGPGCQYRDIAEGEYSRHSDNLQWSNHMLSNLANDGDPKTCSYTAEVDSQEKKTKPFWRVWLPTNETIRELTIVTAKDNLEYFKHFAVYVEYVSKQMREENDNRPLTYKTCHRHWNHAPKDETILVVCNSPVVGNQVRIELGELKTQLVLCDVRINGGRNLAFRRNASQSSNSSYCRDHDGCLARKAVDGNDDQSSLRQCSYTHYDHNPWLSLDLGQEAQIWYTRILPSTYNSYKPNLRLDVSISRNGKWETIEDNINSQRSQTSLNVSLSAIARVVKLTELSQGWQQLKICEVKVFGDCVEDVCGYDCKGECYCKHTNVRDKISGKCSSGCKDGWKGPYCNQCDGSQCQIQCGHCSDPNKCDLSTGTCLTGCKNGYYPTDCKKECSAGMYGQNCTIPCSMNCKDNQLCDSVNGQCVGGCKPGNKGHKCDQKCVDGYYGTNCSFKCSPQCKKKTVCAKADGRCPSGCKRGYTGDKCVNKCSAGMYGKKCANECSMNCKDNRPCDYVSGQCVGGCKPGYKGDKCDLNCDFGKYGQNCTEACSTHCKDNHRRCEHVNGHCVRGCKPGYKGDKCNLECNAGQYGQNCTEACSMHCYDNYRRCESVNGFCIEGCKSGYQGKKCDLVCNAGKYGQNCTEGCSTHCSDNHRRCDSVNGHCVKGCKPGYRGEKCDLACNAGKYGQHCGKYCSNNCKDKLRRCNSVNGRCVGGCKPGHQGDKCDIECNAGKYGQNCTEGCSTHCSDNHRRCDSVNGHCVRGCKPGYRGDKCDLACNAGKYGQHCGKYCSNNCKDKLRRCNSVNGRCVGGCKPGYQGDKCDIECNAGKYGYNCSEVCSMHCKDDRSCDFVNGHCVRGCEPGYRGDKCDRKCDDGWFGPGCKSSCPVNCKNNKKCNDVNGQCVKGCKPGYQGGRCEQICDDGQFGEDCKDSCSVNCKHGNRCKNVNGQCVEGCKPGYEGRRCEQQCTIGLYGDDCVQNCSENCEGGVEKCSRIDGRCQSGCKEGWTGANCDTECDDGFHGTNCTMKCGFCKPGTFCNKVFGTCTEGCATGFVGNKCLQALQKSDSSMVSIVGGVAAFVIFLVITLIVIVAILRRKKRQRKEDKTDSVELAQNHTAYVNASATTSNQEVHNTTSQRKRESNIYTNAILVDVHKQSKYAIPVSTLMEHVKESAEQILEEFKTLPLGMKHPSTVGMKPYNRGKNKYKDMLAYDHSRVILTTLRGEQGSDYINASFIKGNAKEQAYIAAQGPIATTIDDFWRMIEEKGVYTIAMLTNLVEDTKMKCLQYWPTVETSTKFGGYTVCSESETIYAEFTIRNLQVSFEGQPPRNIRQFHYTAWPDKGVPRSTSSLLQFWRKVRKNDSSKSHTWLVHCSAGVGRTGTFIATDILHDQVTAKGFVDVYQCVKDLRDQRVCMVQTKDQYMFLYGLVIETFVLPSEPVSLDNFQQVVTDLKNVDPNKRKTKLLLQYMTLNEDMSYLSPSENDDERYSAAMLAENRNKNRCKEILPTNENRPFLITNIPNCTNYINAVFIPSYSEIRGYIITQTPLKNTAIDCCRLVYEQDVKVIVTFEDENVKKEVGVYLPENGSINLGPFKVMKAKEEDKLVYTQRTFTMSYGKEDREIIQLSFKAWPKGRVIPNDPRIMLDFIQKVEYYKRVADNKPVIVQCMNGSDRSGLLAVLMNIMDRARLENEVSIPQVIRHLRVRREQIIPNFEQFKFCYDVLLYHIESNAMYANM